MLENLLDISDLEVGTSIHIDILTHSFEHVTPGEMYLRYDQRFHGRYTQLWNTCRHEIIIGLQFFIRIWHIYI